MAEINNNIPNFGHKVEKIDTKTSKQPLPCDNKSAEVKDNEFVKDTGVLGRSQIKATKQADIAKSVDDAVQLAKTNPALLCGSESLFDTIYKNNIENGMNDSEAYMNALLAEEEFLQICQHH